MPQHIFAEIYKWYDENGKLHFSDTPPEKSKSTEINMDELVTKSSGVKLSTPDTTQADKSITKAEEPPTQIFDKGKIKSDSTLLSSCTRHGHKKCFYPKDETICYLRYGVPCDDIHFWKEKVKKAYKLRTGDTGNNPYYILENRPLGLLESHLDKAIPTHRNTNKRNLKCLIESGFYCEELSSLEKCDKEYDMSCIKLRNWKKEAITRCENSHGVDCDSDEHLKNYRPLSIEEYNRNDNVIGSHDSLLRNHNFEKDNKNRYKEMQDIIDRFDGK